MGINNPRVDQDFIELTDMYESISRWVVLRHFRVGEYSQYYNEITKEGVGGPAYKYDDYIIKGYSKPVNTSRVVDSGLSRTPFDVVDNTYIEYYFDKNMSTVRDNRVVNTILNHNDWVYEIDWIGENKPQIEYGDDDTPLVNGSKILKKFSIKIVIPYKLNYGQPQFYAAICDFDKTFGG
jgi:hypothetical protein